MEENKESKKWYSNPIVGIVGLIITIGSLAFAVYSHYINAKERDIKYFLQEPTSLVFDGENSSSSIKLIENDSAIIADNVYLLTGKVWNSGNLPIDPKDVRKPLTLNVVGAQRIIEYKVVREKDDSIAKFNLTQTSATTITVDWDYFDPKYGFVFQIMYIGEPEPEFSLSGKILGIDNINNKVVLEKGLSDINISAKIRSYFSVAIFVLTILFGYIRYRYLTKRKREIERKLISRKGIDNDKNLHLFFKNKEIKKEVIYSIGMVILGIVGLIALLYSLIFKSNVPTL